MTDHFPGLIQHLNKKKKIGVKLVLCAQTFSRREMMRSCKCFRYASKMPNIIKDRTWRVSLVEQKLLIHPEHQTSPPPQFSVAFVLFSQIVSAVLSRRPLFSFRLVTFGHCIICPSVYVFWFLGIQNIYYIHVNCGTVLGLLDHTHLLG